jgi:hypothetical protein
VLTGDVWVSEGQLQRIDEHSQLGIQGSARLGACICSGIVLSGGTIPN